MNQLVPTVVPNLMPSFPVLSRSGTGWRGVDLQSYRHPPAAMDHPGIADESLVIHMAGKVIIKDHSLKTKRVGCAAAGSISLNPAGMRVRREWKGRPEVLLLCLKPAFMTALAEDLEIPRSGVEFLPQLAVPDPILHQLGELLRGEATQPGLGSTLLVQSTLCSLGVHLLRRYSTLSAPAAFFIRPTLSSARLRRVVDYMAAHLDRPISLAELAAVCGISESHFTRAFRGATRLSPHAFLTDLRLEKAKKLLEQSRLDITSIALSCGFAQPQYFATLFHRKIGLTPSAWRLQHGR